MSYYQNVRPLEEKLASMLAEESMVHSLKTNQYPILLTVSQDVSPEAQMELFCTRDSALSSRDAMLQFIFKLEGLEIRTDNRLIISDDMMSKIKNYAKKIYHAYLEGFFAEHIGLADAADSKDADLYAAPEATNEGDEDFSDFFDSGEDIPT